MKSGITHTITAAITLCIGIYIGLYFATKVLLTRDIASETTMLVSLQDLREKGYTAKADEITEDQIDNDIQAIKRLHSGDISIFKYWTPKSLEMMSKQKVDAITFTHDFFKDKESRLSEDTKVYLEKQAME
jgi:hypothetical protein